MHEKRRAALISDLAGGDSPVALVFVCYGNVCRSPYAEHSARRMLGMRHAKVAISSLGFVGPHRSPPDLALAEAGRRGLDMSPHRSRLVTAGAPDGAVICVMNVRQARDARAAFPNARAICILGDLDPRSITTREIADPWGKPQDAFASSYDRIDLCLQSLIGIWW